MNDDDNPYDTPLDGPRFDPYEGGGRVAPDQLRARSAVHLCPECRELMSGVLRAARPSPTPRPAPDWVRALRWLDAVCGSRDAVLALDATPLAPVEVVFPGSVTTGERQRLESTLTLLDAVAGQFFNEEVCAALRRALLLTFARRPGVVTGARSAALLALGVVWAVGHANGLLYPLGSVTEKELRQYLAATQSGSAVGAKVRDALIGPYPWASEDRPWTYGGYRARDYEPLGHAELLVSGTRRQLIGVRERALAAQAAAAAAA